MSFIHYKLITNKNFEKITFDGVSLSVFDLKKIILEKKFRKQVAAPTGKNGVNTTMPNKKNSDVDLEITNADTNEVYQRDTDLIPKNSRVRINRVLKSIGPAIAGGVTTSTQKQKEEKAQLSSLRDKFNTLSNAYSSPGSSPVNDFLEKNTDDESSMYSDFMGKDESNSNSSSLSMPYTEINGTHPLNPTDISPLVTSEEKSALKLKVTIPSQQIAKSLPFEAAALPSAELLCPFMSEAKTLHLMDQAIIVPCCGYFICCEDCIRDRLDQNSYVECPHAGCIQEITSSHRLTPEMQIRNRVTKFIASNPTFTSLSTVPENMVVIRPKESATNDQSKLKPDNISSFTPIKINLPGSNKASSESPKDVDTPSPTTEHTGDILSLELDIDTKERSRSRSRTTTTSSRSSSNSSSTSHGTIKSSSSGSRSEKTPNLNTTPVTDEVPVEVPAATAPIVSQSHVVAPIQKTYNQYYNPSSQSMPFNQQMAQQQQFGNQFYNQQHMGQSFYNQQYDTNYRFILFQRNFRQVMPQCFLPIGSVR